MFQLVSCSFSTIPICPFLIQRIFPFTCNIIMVHVCMNTQAQTPTNTLVVYAESLYRACSWLVDVQGVLQASDIPKIYVGMY